MLIFSPFIISILASLPEDPLYAVEFFYMEDRAGCSSGRFNYQGYQVDKCILYTKTNQDDPIYHQISLTENDTKLHRSEFDQGDTSLCDADSDFMRTYEIGLCYEGRKWELVLESEFDTLPVVPLTFEVFEGDDCEGKALMFSGYEFTHDQCYGRQKITTSNAEGHFSYYRYELDNCQGSELQRRDVNYITCDQVSNLMIGDWADPDVYAKLSYDPILPSSSWLLKVSVMLVLMILLM